jgi:hypothetical protein
MTYSTPSKENLNSNALYTALLRTLVAEILRELVSSSSPEGWEAKLRRASRIPEISLSDWTTSNLAASTCIFILSISDMFSVLIFSWVARLDSNDVLRYISIVYSYSAIVNCESLLTVPYSSVQKVCIGLANFRCGVYMLLQSGPRSDFTTVARFQSHLAHSTIMQNKLKTCSQCLCLFGERFSHSSKDLREEIEKINND